MLIGTSGRVVRRRFLTDATNDSLPLTKFEIQLGYSYLGAGSWIDRAPTENIVEKKVQLHGASVNRSGNM